MAATLDEVLQLAKGTHGLSQEQLSRILALAPEMGEDDLEKLKAHLMDLQDAAVKDLKATVDIHQKVDTEYRHWQENTAQNADAASAEATLKTL